MTFTAGDGFIVCNFGRWLGTTLVTIPAHANWVEVALVDWRGHR